jgi:hypothetical protein
MLGDTEGDEVWVNLKKEGIYGAKWSLIRQLFVQILHKLKNLAEVREDVENINTHINKRIQWDHQNT